MQYSGNPDKLLGEDSCGHEVPPGEDQRHTQDENEEDEGIGVEGEVIAAAIYPTSAEAFVVSVSLDRDARHGGKAEEDKSQLAEHQQLNEPRESGRSTHQDACPQVVVLRFVDLECLLEILLAVLWEIEVLSVRRWSLRIFLFLHAILLLLAILHPLRWWWPLRGLILLVCTLVCSIVVVVSPSVMRHDGGQIISNQQFLYNVCAEDGLVVLEIQICAAEVILTY